jgi:hypothetical protein
MVPDDPVAGMRRRPARPGPKQKNGMAQIKAFLGNTFDTVSVHEPKAEAQEIIENRRFASWNS